MPPRLVFLSDHSPYARLLVSELVRRGVRFDAVLVVRPTRLSGTGLKYWLGSLIWPTRAWLRFYRHQKPFYAALPARALLAGDMNSARMQCLLQQLAPDYLVVGCGKILKPNIIETAKCGVFNCHPGLLPWMRGSGVVAHSLARGVPVGVTMHYIDAGIDTGALIERRLLPITKASHELDELERATHELSVRLLADVLLSIVQNGQKPVATTQTVRFPLFRWPPKEERPTFDSLAQSGCALELFEAWKPFTDGEPDWKLSPDLMEAPFALDETASRNALT